MSELRRIVILAEGNFSPLSAKTAAGVIRYSPHTVVGVIDSTQAGKTVQDVLGYGGEIPVLASLEEALGSSPQVLMIGIAPTGGQLPAPWRHTIVEAISNHLDVWSGLHFFLSDDEEFVELAEIKGVRLWDVRRPGRNLPIARAKSLETRGFVVLTVGSDCNVGKMTTALELQRTARQRGYKAGFVATGQTGILIEGEGTPLDAVPGDFMSGEVEQLVMKCDAEGDDIIFVEGQGTLLHPAFGPVTLALMLGAMPDAFIMCHQPTRVKFRPGYDLELPPLPFIIDNYEHLMRFYKAPRVLGIALNTFDMAQAEAAYETEQIARLTGLPTVDPIRNGVEALFDALEPGLRKKLGR